MSTEDLPQGETTSIVESPFVATMTRLNPVGWWRLGETTGSAADSSGNGNSGIYHNFGIAQRGVPGAIANDADGAIEVTAVSTSSGCSKATSPYVSIPDNDQASLDKAQDYFGRTVPPGMSWGTADVGGTWTAEVTRTGAYYSVHGGRALIAERTTGTWQVGLPIMRTDADIQVRASWSRGAVGGTLVPVALVGRRIDNANNYRAELREHPGGQLDLRIVKVYRGTSTVLAAATGVGHYVANDAWYVRFQLNGTNLRARTWNASATAAPSRWLVAASDSQLAVPGNISIRSSNSGTTVHPTVAFDAFRVQSVGMTVHVFMRPTNLDFSVGASGYIYWLGKGNSSHSEWGMLMYPATDRTRPKRVSGYMWSLAADSSNPAHQGAGAYFQNSTLVQDDWYQVVVVYDPGDKFDPAAGVTIYVNGGCIEGTGCGAPPQHVLYTTAPYDVIPENSVSPLLIGTRDCASFFTGDIDEVAIFDRKLTSAEIRDLYISSQ